MKLPKIMSAVLLLLLCGSLLTGCANDVPKPRVKEGRFHFSVTYEVNGEEKTISGVYVCKFKRAEANLTGHNRIWKAYIENSKIKDVERYEILTNEDGVIYLDLGLDPRYFMSDPFYENDCLGDTLEAYAFIVYHDSCAEEKGYFSTEPEILADYGVRVIRCEYDDPIENVYE